MDERDFLVKEIKALSENIRSKHQALKVGINERDAFLENTFKPIVTPLNQISSKLDQTKEDKTNTPETRKFSTKIASETDTYDSEYEDSVNVDEEEEEGVKQETTSNLSILGKDIVNKGELSRKYLMKFLDENPGSKRNFHVYGARLTNDGLMIGDSKLDIDDSDNITVAGKVYSATPGLFELIFKRTPNKYQKKDLTQFHRICKDTNAYRKQYIKTNSYHKNRSKKFLNIIAPLLPSSTVKKGSGMSFKHCDQSNIVYYNNVNELIDRARIIYDAIQSGHTGLNNEWLAIVEVLKKKNIVE